MVEAGRRAISVPEHNRSSHPSFTAFERFAFIMAATVAHEPVHFFVGFLTGDCYPATPEVITYLPNLYNGLEDDGTALGESGRAWEGSVFGSTFDCFEDDRNLLGARQAGDIFLINDQEQTQELDHECMRRILNFGMMWYPYPRQPGATSPLSVN